MRNFISTLVALVLLIAPAVNATAQESTLEQIKNSGKIRIGYRESEPPMSFLNKDKEPIGYSIDLCKRIASAVKSNLDKSDISIEYVPVNAENRFTALQENKIDILCGATTKTLSRGELVDFTQLTFATGASLMSTHKNPVTILGDLEGKKVAVVKNTTSEKVLKSSLKRAVTDAEIVLVDSSVQAFDMLKKGEVAAYCSDQIVLIGVLLTSENPKDYGISDNTFSYEPFALAVRRNDADFRLVADKTLSQLNRTGQILDIYGKWFGQISDKIPSAVAALYQINSIPK